jgi:hypothetical protein
VFAPAEPGVEVTGGVRLGDCAGIAAVFYHEGTKDTNVTKNTTL